MKRCAYCGQEYPDDASECVIDKQPLSGVESSTLPAPPPANRHWHKISREMKIFAHPLVITGLSLMIFSAFVLLDALMSLAWSEAAIGGVLGSCGWLLHRSGVSRKSRRLTWLGFLAIILPSLPIFYVLGYFALMDRSQPTDPAAVKHFQSSLRWMPYSRGWGQRRPYHDVTIFNIIYSPADKIYFKWFPRTDEELQRLKALGYFQ
jgi:hypothetical protein